MKQLLIILSATFFAGCRLFQPTAYLFITTSSEDKTPVDIHVKIGGETIFNDTISYTPVIPDLRNTPYVTLPKGKNVIIVTADSGKVSDTRPFMLDTDRWIFINYSYKKAPDSAKSKILKEMFWYDTAYLNKKLREMPPQITIHITAKEPIHQ